MAALLMEKKTSDLFSEPSMHFWGIQCCSGKFYAQVVGERFRITMAVLDPKSAPKVVKSESDKIVSLIVKRGAYEYLLCVLKHGEIHQVNLNLVFDKGENVIFYVRGRANVCLSGYQLTESERDVMNDEIGYLCPLVEVKSEKTNSENLPHSDPESVSSKRKKKAKKEEDFVTSEDRKMLKSWNAMSNRKKNGEVKVLEFNDDDDDSDESDEDFSLGEEESSESLESEEECDEEIEEELEEEIKMLSEYEVDDEVAKLEPEEKSSSRKRKLEKISQLQENSVDDKDSSDSDVEALSADDTPSPKKKIETENSSEKISKKKKKKLDESTSSEKSVVPKESTPKTAEKAETTPSQKSVQKLEGGIELQDVIVGKGPVATKGKTVHVFYVGRFQNKQIFDSRTPGKKPFSFKLGAQQVIKGWDIGLQGMKVGGKRKLKIPPSMGYGSSGIEGIPPNSTLFFLVELAAVS